MQKYSLSLLLSVFFISTSASAADIRFSGFMSIVGGMTLEDGATYQVGSLGKEASYDDKFRFAADSIAGLQAQAVVNNRTRATLQLVGRGDTNYEINAEWANVSYDVTDSLTLTAGRFRAPAYYYSDFFDVGYAYYWIRPPAELYAGPSSLDGATVVYTTYLGDYQLTTQYFYGTSSLTALTNGVDVDIDISSSNGLIFRVDYDWFTIRAFYAQFDFKGTLPSTGAVVRDGTFSHFGGAFVVDYNNLLLRSEFNALDNGTEDASNWYASMGYRIGEFTPHVTYLTEGAIPTNGVPEDSNVYTVGIAWNYSTSAVLKAEYSYKALDQSDDVSLIATGIDVIF